MKYSSIWLIAVGGFFASCSPNQKETALREHVIQDSFTLMEVNKKHISDSIALAEIIQKKTKDSIASVIEFKCKLYHSLLSCTSPSTINTCRNNANFYFQKVRLTLDNKSNEMITDLLRFYSDVADSLARDNSPEMFMRVNFGLLLAKNKVVKLKLCSN